MWSQLKIQNNFFPCWDLNGGPPEQNASVLSMSYADIQKFWKLL